MATFASNKVIKVIGMQLILSKYKLNFAAQSAGPGAEMVHLMTAGLGRTVSHGAVDLEQTEDTS